MQQIRFQAVNTPTETSTFTLVSTDVLAPQSLLSTATEHALQRRQSFGVIVGVTISFSVLCNDDCYRASLTMHTDVASLSNSATLPQSMCLRA